MKYKVLTLTSSPKMIRELIVAIMMLPFNNIRIHINYIVRHMAQIEWINQHKTLEITNIN